MLPTFSIKQGDLLPPLVVELRDQAGNVIDLTSTPPATVTLRYKPINGSGATVEKAMSIVAPATAGLVQYDWVARRHGHPRLLRCGVPRVVPNG